MNFMHVFKGVIRKIGLMEAACVKLLGRCMGSRPKAAQGFNAEINVHNFGRIN